MNNNIVLWFPIGWTGSDPAKRYVRAVTPETGWRGFVDDLVRPALDWLGPDWRPRIQLHNPFGVSGAPMPADGWVEAVEMPLPWLTDTFCETMHHLTAEGIEVICYLGNPQIDPDFQAELIGGRLDNWLRRFWRSYRPALEANCSLALDAASWQPAGSICWHSSRLLQCLLNQTEAETPARFYVEATARLETPEWFDCNQQIVESTFQARHVAGGPGMWAKYPAWRNGDFVALDPAGNVTAEHLYGGEILRICKADYMTADAARAVLADGHTALLPAWWFTRNVTGPQDLT